MHLLPGVCVRKNHKSKKKCKTINFIHFRYQEFLFGCFHHLPYSSKKPDTAKLREYPRLVIGVAATLWYDGLIFLKWIILGED